jgi:hypothetical protein
MLHEIVDRPGDSSALETAGDQLDALILSGDLATTGLNLLRIDGHL